VRPVKRDLVLVVQRVRFVQFELEPYVGSYLPPKAPPESTPYKILYQNGNLAVDVPDRMVFELNGPGDKGQWTFKISPSVTVSFSRDEDQNIEGMLISQLIKIQQGKPAAEDDIPEDVPEEYLPWLGTYPIPTQGIVGNKFTDLFLLHVQ